MARFLLDTSIVSKCRADLTKLTIVHKWLLRSTYRTNGNTPLREKFTKRAMESETIGHSRFRVG